MTFHHDRRAPWGGCVLELRGITKRFPGVVANDDVNLSVEEGEIHAICGENGAGKSTLMKILYGMQPPDEGTMKIWGTEIALHSPSEAIELGIGMVHQHFMLADQLTVLENVILGSEPLKSLGRIDFADLIMAFQGWDAENAASSFEELLEVLIHYGERCE